MTYMEEEQRECVVSRGDGGFGFVLCCENDTTDTYVLHVINSSPACQAGLRPGDRMIEVDGVNVEKEEHKEIVQRLQGLPKVRLLVAHNNDVEEYFKEPGNGMTVKPIENGARELRPKLITMQRGKMGYDFTLQTVGKTSRDEEDCCHRTPLKGISGHYASKVYENGIAHEAGLREGNRIVQINGIDIDQESHGYVIAVIKSSQELELLIVDRETDEFFQKYGVSPTSKHLHGEVEFKNAQHTCTNFDQSSQSGESSSGGKPLFHRQSVTTPPSRALLPHHTRLHRSLMARSTPNLTNVGIGRSKSWSTIDSHSDKEKSKFRISASKAKRKIQKHFSKLERKPSKSNLYKVNLPEGRKLYDETIVSDDAETTTSSTSSHPNVDNLFSQLSIQNKHTNGFSHSVVDVSMKQPSMQVYKPVNGISKEKPVLNYESTECKTSPRYDSVEELSTVGYKVDLKTLKEHVRKKSNQKKHEIVKSKSKLSDYSLAHMYVNSY